MFLYYASVHMIIDAVLHRFKRNVRHENVFIHNKLCKTGFPRRLENENGHGKVMEHEKLAKSHGIL